MKIGVWANDLQWKELNASGELQDCMRMDSLTFLPGDVDAFLLLDAFVLPDFNPQNKPVIVNSTNITLRELKVADNVYRINGWNSFLSRAKWEIAGNNAGEVKDVFVALKKVMITVPDEPGLISARVVSMIINEAYFALDQNISSKYEIDIAMKTGTNYPYGPFEWALQIGLNNIVTLLEKLAQKDKRYTPSSLLKQEALHGLNIKY